MSDLEKALQNLTKALGLVEEADGLFHEHGRYGTPKYDKDLQEKIFHIQCSFFEMKDFIKDQSDLYGVPFFEEYLRSIERRDRL